METGPARDAVLRTYPSAVSWKVEPGDRPYRPDGLMVLAFLVFGLGVGFLATGFIVPAGALLSVVGAALTWWRFKPACERDPIFRSGRDSHVRLSSARDLTRMAVSQGSAIATGFGLAGVLVLLFVRSQPAWGVGLIIAAAFGFAVVLLVFRQIARSSGA